MMYMNQLTMNDFEPHVNSTFAVHYGGEEPLELTLVSVTPLGEPPDPGQDRRQSFSLLFTNLMTDKYLVQQIYEVVHSELGTLQLFLVPMGPGKGGMAYEAVFS